MRTLPSPKTLYFFNAKNLWAYKYTRCGTSIHFENINLQYFGMFLNNNLKKFREKKWFNQTIWFYV